MAYFDIIWNDEAGGNVEHIRDNGVSVDEVKEVLFSPN